MAALSEGLAGCLSVRETRFLAPAAATMPTSLGEVLEIGSFKGKSATLLAKSVALVGGDRVCAVDPLFAASDTVPPIESGENLPDVLHPAEGPIRMFCERILLFPAFGPCGWRAMITNNLPRK